MGQDRWARWWPVAWGVWFVVSFFLLPWWLVTFVYPHVHLVLEWVP